MAAQGVHPSLAMFIPRNQDFLSSSDPRWPLILPLLAPNSEACNAIINERMPPLPRKGRAEPVRRYRPFRPSLQDWILQDVNNTECLVRVYLGSARRPRGTDQPPPKFFTLRNIPMHVDQFSEMGFDPVRYSKTMAEGLVFLWWRARVDANDVEFILAGCLVRTTMTAPAMRTTTTWITGAVGMNDAGQCRSEVHQLEDTIVRQASKDIFLETSEQILQGESDQVREIPAWVIVKIIETENVFNKITNARAL